MALVPITDKPNKPTKGNVRLHQRLDGNLYILDAVGNLKQISGVPMQNNNTIGLKPEVTLGSLVEVPRHSFEPTSRRGYFDWSKIPEFKLPSHKKLIFMGGGRNFATNKGKDVFNWGFTHIDETRMIDGKEYYSNVPAIPNGWVSPIPRERRALSFAASYFTQGFFDIQWAKNYTLWAETFFERTDGSFTKNLGRATWVLIGASDKYRESRFPYEFIFCDVENIGQGNEPFSQETINLWVHMMRRAKEIGGGAQLGTLEPQAYNCFSNAKLPDYNKTTNPNVYLWDAICKRTDSSIARGMPEANIGKGIQDFVDVNQAHNYFYDQDILPAGTYTASAKGREVTGQSIITIDHKTGANWLCNVLAAQEINLIRSDKPRIAYQWLYNNDGLCYTLKKYGNNEMDNGFPDIPLDKNQAEGLGIFFWFTGAMGTILWDNALDIEGVPIEPLLPNGAYNPSYSGQGKDRNMAVYEHYLHGTWRLFANNADIFTGNEVYLNQYTEVSYDNGTTWMMLNAVQIKEAGLPYVRAIVSNNKILVAATKPYGKGNSSVMVRYQYQNGKYWQSAINLTDDNIYLGKATMFLNQ
jgi:hypothetical protein